jgi:hypothetical protein
VFPVNGNEGRVLDVPVAVPQRRRIAAAFPVAAAFIALALFSCSSKPSPATSSIHTTKAFDAVFGDLPPMTAPGPTYATVAYFPSARDSGKFLPAPLFSAEQGKEEMLTVRTVIRGIDAEEFSGEVVFPFPPGSDLDSLSYEGGVARIRVGGKFKAADFSPGQGERAAKALALTVTQFGKATSVEVTDAEGRAHFSGRADQAQTADVGPPTVLGLLAIREDKRSPPSVLSVLFDRPVFVEDIAFFAPQANAPIPGKAYSTGFGMTVDLHPDPKVAFEPGRAYRVRLAVRDGKGKRMSGEKEWISKEATRE